MGHIKEPDGIDFTVDPRPLTEAEQKAISNYIQAEKEKKAAKDKKKFQGETKILRQAS